jgi:hypothetical protein
LVSGKKSFGFAKPKLIWKGPELIKEYRGSLRPKLETAARMIKTKAEELIMARKHGRWRTSALFGFRYVASAPGEAPASTGKLLDNLDYEVGFRSDGIPVARIGVRPAMAGIAVTLIFGRKATLRGAKRPFLAPALQKTRGETSRAIAR